MIGEVEFQTHRGERARAILDESGRWDCPELPVLNRALNILFEPRPESDRGPFGRSQVLAVAAWLHGVARFPQEERPKPSRGGLREGCEPTRLVPIGADCWA